MKIIISIDINQLQVHPEIEKTYQSKKLGKLKFSMVRFGQRQPLTVVKRNENYLITDGVSRYLIAKQLPEKFKTLNCEVFEISDEKVLDDHIVNNTCTKRSTTEICKQVEHILGVLGKQQGVKREMLGLDDLDSDIPKKIKKDRFYWACSLIDGDMKPSTLRRLMKVYWEEESLPKKDRTGVIERLDSGEITINRAYELLKDKEHKQNEIQLLSNLKSEIKLDGLPYKLFNKSSLQLDEIPNNSVRMFIQSPPYWKLRSYPNQDDLKHGRESTTEEYIANQIKFCREIRLKLLPGGVLVIIIGETYRNGYQGICTKLETALEKDDWTILDVNTWVKLNPNDNNHPNRFRNAYERIIVVCKKGAKPVFNDVKHQSSVGKFKVIKGTKRANGVNGFSMASPLASVTNVITTPVSNSKELKEIDPDFKHDAPARLEIYERFILAYSNEGDIIGDGFCGSGTGLEVALRNGRIAYGWDVDPVSIEFCRKRCEIALGGDISKAA